ncbi:hypothetical protein [Protaetiibacter mangrovi]|uniref:CBS domain-containing protein n=1 Tax=Protaetiibacter mangrovi TaxID=2970926 RepID=A0ABT1ZD09_9MICO|nr:hypothetical protein [Protaetiibacter mangrovi]MCS0498575.1 hypothetical protein [Protaetiibacter mangrovi]TPX02461.1 CBS domain-containing protein [Schumannella luteola]
MHASHLATPVQTLPASSTVAEVASRVLDAALPGVVIDGPEPRRVRWVSTADLMRLIAPRYAREDLAVAAVLDSADSRGIEGVRASQIGAVLDDDDVHYEIEQVEADAGLLELALRLVHSRAPLLLVESGDDPPGFVTDAQVLSALTEVSDGGAGRR